MLQSTVMCLQLDLETVVIDEAGSVDVLTTGVRVLGSCCGDRVGHHGCPSFSRSSWE